MEEDKNPSYFQFNDIFIYTNIGPQKANAQSKTKFTFIISGLLAIFSNLHALANPIPWIDER